MNMLRATRAVAVRNPLRTAFLALLSILTVVLLSACGGDDTAEYEQEIEEILEPITALNGEIGTAINVIGDYGGDDVSTAASLDALINLRDASAALEAEAGYALERLAALEVPGKCQRFHDLVATAMTAFQQMGAEYALGADITADGRDEELIDLEALERGDAHLETARAKLDEASGAPTDECSG